VPTKRHNNPRTQGDRVLTLVRRRGFLRPRDLEPFGLSRETLRRLEAKGQVVRRGRGLYVAAGDRFDEQETLAVASTRIPHGVVCLLSALRFHDLTTQNPSEIWLAIDRKARLPKTDDLPLRIVRFSGEAWTAGIQEHRLNRTVIRVYNAAKTVADCFKYRRKIGIDVAVEALRDCWQNRKATADELWRYATICRVTNVMQPYLETVLSIQPADKALRSDDSHR
jgi:predicted transcriptional regulator of viral defense system